MGPKCSPTNLAPGPATLFAGNETMNLTLMMASTVRGLGVLFLLTALSPMKADAQPRVSFHVQRLAFSGNLLKCADGTFIAEKGGELHRLTSTGAYDRKLDFDPTHPVGAFTASETYFKRIFAPLADGGFFAVVDFRIPNLGLVTDRLARFDRDGRLVWADDRSYESPFDAGAQL